MTDKETIEQIKLAMHQYVKEKNNRIQPGKAETNLSNKLFEIIEMDPFTGLMLDQ
jgi:uncharacterized radical SAM superfamily Fe-S cluster-containing enzyme